MATAHVDWQSFTESKPALFLWEAFVSGDAKGADHVADATVAVRTFLRAMPNPTLHCQVSAEEPLSLVGASLLRTGWRTDPGVLATPPIVIKA